MESHFADIILPFAVKGRFTYIIPDDMLGRVLAGMRVQVHFRGRNLYTGIVFAVHNNQPDYKNIKPILSLQDEIPLINEQQLKLWVWMSEYYLCSEGEVMKAALPSEKSINEFRPRLETCIGLFEKFSEDEMNKIIDKLAKAPRQYDLLLAFLRITGYPENLTSPVLSKSILLNDSHPSPGILDSLIRKKILNSISLPVSRIDGEEKKNEQVKELSPAQEDAY